MNNFLSPGLVTVALLVGLTQFGTAARAGDASDAAAPLSQPPSPEVRFPAAMNSPAAWIAYPDSSYTPVVDDVSRDLAAARVALAAKDFSTSAAELRLAATELRAQSEIATKIERFQAQFEIEDARRTASQLVAAAAKLDTTADAMDAGNVRTQTQLDQIIDGATRADMERRWLVADVTAWYPASEGAQNQFTDAANDYAKQDYRSAAEDIRKASAYVRLEADRASGAARRGLDSSAAQLDALASSTERGATRSAQVMAAEFARTNHALALDHRSKAVASWSHDEYAKTGYELKAAADGMDDAAGWLSARAQSDAARTVAATRVLGGKLVSGAIWTRDEVTRGLDTLGRGLDTLGTKLTGSKRASSAHAAAG